ncbi:hypothetical protein BRPE67_DCDS01020 (plasmid) [Caballeronia cordobensis]|nr:hypothetical protein BRPE67_DCDS01020 [Burkholderia sp. RPE67]
MQPALESRGDIIYPNFYTGVIVAEIAKGRDGARLLRTLLDKR